VIAAGNHVVEQNLSLAQAVAQHPLLASKVDLPHHTGAEQECDRWLKERGIEKFALLNPGAGWGAKQWPPDRYGQVAITLIENGLKILVNFGPGEDEIAHAVKAASNGAAETFTGSLTQLIALMRRARLLIGGDTGPMHLASALGVPVVGIFGPTNPARNGPFGTRNIVLRSSSSVTSYSHVADPDAGLLDISPEQVISAARRLLKESHG
jgi:heptosyltransferase I